ncbi:histidinol-phosphate transaminase [Sulfurimonas diazotrophicus]|uniref:Histidinol-phosphate aminotransferase n=1 Tax=Sulfurimonas diazotrophicus TaxID=3131939 RepID=A0ABZ3HBG3_9BACT
MTFNQTLDAIRVYEAGKPIELVVREFGIEPKDIIKLASNENPFGCSPKVQEAVSAIVSKMALYPDDSMYKLKDGLAKRFGIDPHEVVIGAGSDQVIEFAVHAKTGPGKKILINSITFAMYEIYAHHVGAEVIRTASRAHDLDEFYALYLEHKPSIIFLCTPNNPTGDSADAADVKAFLSKIDRETLVIVDGAYMEYARYKDSAKALEPKELIEAYDNVLYLGTFSKAYGLGGMRVGYGIAQRDIITALYKLRPPFNITTLSLEAASAALEDEAFVQRCIAKNFEEMDRYEAFAEAHGIRAIESYTNFVTLCLKEGTSSTEVADALLRQGMIVRNLAGYGLNAIRVTVGKPEENDRFFALAAELV